MAGFDTCVQNAPHICPARPQARSAQKARLRLTIATVPDTATSRTSGTATFRVFASVSTARPRTIASGVAVDPARPCRSWPIRRGHPRSGGRRAHPAGQPRPCERRVRVLREAGPGGCGRVLDGWRRASEPLTNRQVCAARDETTRPPDQTNALTAPTEASAHLMSDRGTACDESVRLRSGP